MELTHIATESGKSGCPSFWATDRGTYVVQGWKVTDAQALAALRERGLPDHEDAVEIPAALIAHIQAQA